MLPPTQLLLLFLLLYSAPHLSLLLFLSNYLLHVIHSFSHSPFPVLFPLPLSLSFDSLSFSNSLLPMSHSSQSFPPIQHPVEGCILFVPPVSTPTSFIVH